MSKVGAVLVVGGGIDKLRSEQTLSIFCRDVAYNGYRWGAL